MIKAARALRLNMTDAEKLLWKNLRRKQLGVKFRRQYPLLGYIVDFVSFEKRLIIEVDGGQHLESKQDKVRDQTFREGGFMVLRFWNTDVLRNVEGVVEAIKKEVDTLPFIPPGSFHELPSREGK